MSDKLLVVAGCIRPGATTLNIHPDFGSQDEWAAVIGDAAENVRDEPEGLGFLWEWSDEHTDVRTNMLIDSLNAYEDDMPDREFWRKGEW